VAVAIFLTSSFQSYLSKQFFLLQERVVVVESKLHSLGLSIIGTDLYMISEEVSESKSHPLLWHCSWVPKVKGLQETLITHTEPVLPVLYFTRVTVQALKVFLQSD
jgi:hypothetical protein